MFQFRYDNWKLAALLQELSINPETALNSNNARPASVAAGRPDWGRRRSCRAESTPVAAGLACVEDHLTGQSDWVLQWQHVTSECVAADMFKIKMTGPGPGPAGGPGDVDAGQCILRDG
jgi:hypothetical protein